MRRLRIAAGRFCRQKPWSQDERITPTLPGTSFAADAAPRPGAARSAVAARAREERDGPQDRAHRDGHREWRGRPRPTLAEIAQIAGPHRRNRSRPGGAGTVRRRHSSAGGGGISAQGGDDQRALRTGDEECRRKGMAEIRTLVASVNVIPTPRPQPVELEIEGQLAALLSRDGKADPIGSPPTRSRGELGAGIGFEPMTFRL